MDRDEVPRLLKRRASGIAPLVRGDLREVGSSLANSAAFFSMICQHLVDVVRRHIQADVEAAVERQHVNLSTWMSLLLMRRRLNLFDRRSSFCLQRGDLVRRSD